MEGKELTANVPCFLGAITKICRKCRENEIVRHGGTCLHLPLPIHFSCGASEVLTSYNHGQVHFSFVPYFLEQIEKFEAGISGARDRPFQLS